MSGKIEVNWANLNKLETDVTSKDGPGQFSAEFNEEFIKEYRATKGKMLGDLAGAPCLLVTIRGRKTGKERVHPLGYVKVEGRLFIIGSRGGTPDHPNWYLNLVANPEVTVEIDDQIFKADTVTLQGPERDRIFEAVKAALPAMGEYQTRTTRELPVVEILRRS